MALHIITKGPEVKDSLPKGTSQTDTLLLINDGVYHASCMDHSAFSQVYILEEDAQVRGVAYSHHTLVTATYDTFVELAEQNSPVVTW